MSATGGRTARLPIRIGTGGSQEWLLRPWSSDDEAALVKYADNRAIWIRMRDLFPHPYTEQHARAWIEHTASLDPLTELAIASPVEAIGGIGLRLQEDIHRRSAEIGYWLAEPFWGRGIATLAVEAFVPHAFATLDLVRIYATVLADNAASMRVLEKAGFELEGRLRQAAIKDGRIIDQLLYAHLRHR